MHREAAPLVLGFGLAAATAAVLLTKINFLVVATVPLLAAAAALGTFANKVL